MKLPPPLTFALILMGAYSVACVADENTLTLALFDQISQLESQWRPGDAMSEYNYYSRASQLAKSLFRYEKSSADAASLKLLTNVLAKRRGDEKIRDADYHVSVADLVALEDLGRYMLAEGNISYGDQRKKIAPVSQLLGRIRTEIVPNHEPRKTARGLLIVESPETHTSNEAAIRANNANVLTNNRQRQLSNMADMFTKLVLDFLSRVASGDPGARQQVNAAMVMARLTDAEVAEVRKEMH